MSVLKYRMTTLLLISCLVSVSLCHAVSQSLESNSIKLPASLHFSDVEFRISGTSNVRDWKIVSDSLGGTISFGPALTNPGDSSDNPGKWINTVYLYIPKHSLDSGNNIMNQTMNKSLKSEAYPNLEYRMSGVQDMLVENGSAERNFIVTGVLGAAGAEYEVTHMVTLHQLSGKQYQIFGDFDLNMTDFDIEPPTFMRGTLTTTDAIRVDYSFTIILSD
jgi:hypothetical protein